VTADEAYRVLGRNGFLYYMGPGYDTRHAVNDFMKKHPRGKGIKGHRKDLLELYEACRVIKIEWSRTRSWTPHALSPV
jgi:hypothetical protein